MQTENWEAVTSALKVKKKDINTTLLRYYLSVKTLQTRSTRIFL